MDLKRKLAAIIVADVVGYSKLIAVDEEATLRLLETCRAIWESCAERFGGRIFNTAGDAVLLEFRSAVDAVRCALEVQERAKAANVELPADRQMRFRIGITIGDVVERGADLLGDGVNIAARLQTLAQPGGICVSSWVQEQTANRLPIDFVDLGWQTVKNIPKPIRAYTIVPAGEGRVDGASIVRRRGRMLPTWMAALPRQAVELGAVHRGVLAIVGVALIGVLVGLVWAGWPASKPAAVAISKPPVSPGVATDGPTKPLSTEPKGNDAIGQRVFAPKEQNTRVPGDVFRDCPSCPEMIVVPSGVFTMGAPSFELGSRGDERPQHTVRIAKDFAVGRAAVTRDEFRVFVDGSADYRPAENCGLVEAGRWVDRRDRSWRDPGFQQGGDHPVVCVNWNDAKAYVAWLSRTTGKRYRLPSEAEREYFTRAGTSTPFWWGSEIQPGQANYDASYTYGQGGVRGVNARGTIAAASLKSNPWGLFNVHGNVLEWVEDCDREDYAGAPGDGSAWVRPDCSKRVLRGGSWGYDPKDLRSAYRDNAESTRRTFIYGFRVVRDLDDGR